MGYGRNGKSQTQKDKHNTRCNFLHNLSMEIASCGFYSKSCWWMKSLPPRRTHAIPRHELLLPILPGEFLWTSATLNAKLAFPLN